MKTIDKIRTVSDKLYKLQLSIGASEQRLMQLKAVEENKNFLFYTTEEKIKWYHQWGKKVDREIVIIAENEKKLNKLINSN